MNTRRIRWYADSANEGEVLRLLDEGLVCGVTTNPEILRADGVTLGRLPELARSWVGHGAEEVFFQTWGSTADEMVEHARELLGISPRVCIKAPATEAGFSAAARLVKEGATVLVTAVYNPVQALAAASVGARYIAPYLGRLDDAGYDGAGIIETMAIAVAGTGTEVLAASLRSPDRILDLAQCGVNAFTAKPAVLRQALRAEASDASARAFEEAMESVVD